MDNPEIVRLLQAILDELEIVNTNLEVMTNRQIEQTTALESIDAYFQVQEMKHSN